MPMDQMLQQITGAPIEYTLPGLLPHLVSQIRRVAGIQKVYTLKHGPRCYVASLMGLDLDFAEKAILEQDLPKLTEALLRLRIWANDLEGWQPGEPYPVE